MQSISDQSYGGDLIGGVLRALANSPVRECDFDEAVRQHH